MIYSAGLQQQKQRGEADHAQKNRRNRRDRRNRGKDDCGFADKGARLGYAERLVAGAECIQGEQCCEAVWSAATNINDPPVSLPRRFRVEPVDQFFSCQVLQLLTLEAAARKRLSFNLVALLQTAAQRYFAQGHLGPDAGISPRKPGSLLISPFESMVASLHTAPSNTFEQRHLGHDAGSSPRKPGSLPMNPFKSIVASFQTAPSNAFRSRSIYAPSWAAAEQVPHILRLTKARRSKFGIACRGTGDTFELKRSKPDAQSPALHGDSNLPSRTGIVAGQKSSIVSVNVVSVSAISYCLKVVA